MMISDFPEGYFIPNEALHVEVAAWSGNPVDTKYIMQANGAEEKDFEKDGVDYLLR